MPELEQDGWYECAVCGRRRAAADRCGCATDGGGHGPGPQLPTGWDPGLTAGAGRRLPLMGRPMAERAGEHGDAVHGRTPAAPEPEPGGERERVDEVGRVDGAAG